MDVNINDETCVKKLKVFLNDDPKLIAEEFGAKYGKGLFILNLSLNLFLFVELNEERKTKLISLIEEKINESKYLKTFDSASK